MGIYYKHHHPNTTFIWMVCFTYLCFSLLIQDIRFHAMLMSMTAIFKYKRKIWYFYIVQWQTFLIVMMIHACYRNTQFSCWKGNWVWRTGHIVTLWVLQTCETIILLWLLFEIGGCDLGNFLKLTCAYIIFIWAPKSVIHIREGKKAKINKTRQACILSPDLTYEPIQKILELHN